MRTFQIVVDHLPLLGVRLHSRSARNCVLYLSPAIWQSGVGFLLSRTHPVIEALIPPVIEALDSSRPTVARPAPAIMALDSSVLAPAAVVYYAIHKLYYFWVTFDYTTDFSQQRDPQLEAFVSLPSFVLMALSTTGFFVAVTLPFLVVVSGLPAGANHANSSRKTTKRGRSSSRSPGSKGAASPSCFSGNHGARRSQRPAVLVCGAPRAEEIVRQQIPCRHFRRLRRHPARLQKIFRSSAILGGDLAAVVWEFRASLGSLRAWAELVRPGPHAEEGPRAHHDRVLRVRAASAVFGYAGIRFCRGVSDEQPEVGGSIGAAEAEIRFPTGTGVLQTRGRGRLFVEEGQLVLEEVEWIRPTLVRLRGRAVERVFRPAHGGACLALCDRVGFCCRATGAIGGRDACRRRVGESVRGFPRDSEVAASAGDCVKVNNISR